MGTRTSSPEQSSGRLYYGDRWEESSATLPIAVNGLRRANVTRRALLAKSRAEVVISRIDRELGNQIGAKPPEDVPPHTDHTVAESETELLRPAQSRQSRALGNVAILITTMEEAVDPPPYAQAA